MDPVEPAASEPTTNREGLVRAIGPFALGLAVVNLVVGGGIFVLPGVIAAELGSAAILAYLVCSVAVALVFLCFAEVGSRVVRSGGSYAYVEDAFGPFIGFVASMLFWLGYSAAADAAITVAMIDVLGTVAPILTEPLPRALFTISILAFLAVVNIRGVESGKRLYVFNTIAKLVPLLLLLVVGLFVIQADHLVIGSWPSMAEIGAGAIILFFAFSGAEGALSASGEIKRPARTVPLGLALGIGCLLVLYIGLQTVAQGVLGDGLADQIDAPLTAVATEVFGQWGGQLLLVGLVFSIYGAVSGDMLGVPRVIFAAARDGSLPGALGRVHPRYRTPHVAIIFFASVVIALALSGTFTYLAAVATGSLLLIDLGVILAVLRLRSRDGLPAAHEFTLPLGPTIPLLGAAIVGWLLMQLPLAESASVGVLIAVSAAYYVIRPRRRARR
ncbi:MAG: amino acid permease [Acidobacteria bacterium]|nr:amino acid permease [Acidobacteriota bacterium]